jgi:hypothetical protein
MFNKKSLIRIIILFLIYLNCGIDPLSPLLDNKGTIYFYDSAKFTRLFRYFFPANNRIELNVISIDFSADQSTWYSLYDDVDGNIVSISTSTGVRSTGILLSGVDGTCKYMRITYDWASYISAGGESKNLMDNSSSSDYFIAQTSSSLQLSDGIVIELNLNTGLWLNTQNGNITLINSIGAGATFN